MPRIVSSNLLPDDPNHELFIEEKSGLKEDFEKLATKEVFFPTVNFLKKSIYFGEDAYFFVFTSLLQNYHRWWKH